MNNVICTPSSQEGDPHPIKKAWSTLVRGTVAKPIRIQYLVVYMNIRSIMKIEIRILFFISQWIKHYYLYPFYSTIMQIINENQFRISLANYTLWKAFDNSWIPTLSLNLDCRYWPYSSCRWSHWGFVETTLWRRYLLFVFLSDINYTNDSIFNFFFNEMSIDFHLLCWIMLD